MTTGTGPETPPWHLHWAAAELGGTPQATPEEARAAFLGRLPGVDFVPPPSWRQALNVLSSIKTDLSAADWYSEGWLDEVLNQVDGAVEGDDGHFDSAGRK